MGPLGLLMSEARAMVVVVRALALMGPLAESLLVDGCR